MTSSNTEIVDTPDGSQYPIPTIIVLGQKVHELERAGTRNDEEHRRFQQVIDDLRYIPSELKELRRIAEKNEEKLDKFLQGRQAEEYMQKQLDLQRQSVDQSKGFGLTQAAMGVLALLVSVGSIMAGILIAITNRK